MHDKKPNPYVLKKTVNLLELHNEALLHSDRAMRVDLSGYLATILVSLGLEVCSDELSDETISIIYLLVQLFDQNSEYDEETIRLMGAQIAESDKSGFVVVGSGAIAKFLTFIPQLHASINAALSSAAPPILSKNTWGDGLLVVSPDAAALAEFALRLRNEFAVVRWSSKGLPELSCRIALHTGPVLQMNNFQAASLRQ